MTTIGGHFFAGGWVTCVISAMTQNDPYRIGKALGIHKGKFGKCLGCFLALITSARQYGLFPWWALLCMGLCDLCDISNDPK
jgi:hypothetical protein